MATQHVRVELFYQHTESGVTKYAWHPQLHPDITDAAGAYARNAIGISHGRGAEQGEPTPSSATLTFKSHDYNPENPASPLYGLIGRNTPIRIISGTRAALVDTFTRTTVDGWTGTGALSWVHAGGTVPGDYDVTGGAGTQTHPSANVYHASHVDTGSPDHVVRGIFDLSADDLTGDAVRVELRGRVTDVNNHYTLTAEYSTTEQVSIVLTKRVSGTRTVLATYATAINLLGIAGSDLIGELVVEGNRLYGKLWRRFGGVDEPIAYMVTAEDDALTTGNLAGFASFRFGSNTNANLQARLLDFVAVPGTIRFAGEVADWRPRRAKGGDRWVEVEAGDPLLRLQAPQADALRSALWREILFNGPVAFWPVNDGADSPQIASALPGGAPMSVYAYDWANQNNEVPLDWAPVSYADWVEPIATPAVNVALQIRGAVDMDPAATEWAADFVFVVTPDADNTASVVISAHSDAGSGTRIEWIYGFTVGAWVLTRRTYINDAFDNDLTVSTGSVTYNTGTIIHARLITVRDGADVDWELQFNAVTLDSGTLVGSGWGPLTDMVGQSGTPTGGTAIGFLAAWDTASPPFNAANAAVVGRSGELVGARLARLFEEEGIPFELVGDEADTEAAGPQLIDTLANNAAACEGVDMGLLYGTRHQPGVSYRTRVSLYNQAPLTLDVDGGEVADPLEPVIGTLGVVNDVTVKRRNGSSYRSVAESGPLNVNPPHIDPEGVGRYPADPEVNAAFDEQLPGLADWRRNRGTIKAVRYPQVTTQFGALADAGKTALANSVNRLRIGDRVDLDNAEPTGVMQLVPGYNETIGPTVAEREITLNGTPANVYEIGVYDDSGSRYSSRASSTAAQITTGTDTSLSVAVEAGRALWSTTAAPFDIDLLGARVTVTAISGASSPQTFTISTTVVNGINKVIPSSTPVKLWSPKRYGA